MKSIYGNDCLKCQNEKTCPFRDDCFVANYLSIGGIENFEIFKNELINEFNALEIDGLPKIDELLVFNGGYINMKFPLDNNNSVRFFDDKEVYLGNQIECLFNDQDYKRYFGLFGNMNFLVVCEYSENGDNPELLIYKKI